MPLPNLQGYRTLARKELAARGLKPGSRAVLTPKGEIISRRQYENLRIRNAPKQYGWRSWSHFQSARNSPIYKYDFELAQRQHPELTSKQLRAIDSDFNQLFANAMPWWSKRKSPEYRDPHGPVAAFLTYLGLRSEDASYDVGESPKMG